MKIPAILERLRTAHAKGAHIEGFAAEIAEHSFDAIYGEMTADHHAFVNAAVAAFADAHLTDDDNGACDEDLSEAALAELIVACETGADAAAFGANRLHFVDCGGGCKWLQVKP
jgi:hypothetical protein